MPRRGRMPCPSSSHAVPWVTCPRVSLARLLLPLLLPRGGYAQKAHGPVPGADARYPNVGWATEHYKKVAPSMKDGVLKVQGNSRVYLVQDWQELYWERHKYVRLDLHHNPLSFTLDLSNVPCGCLACVYMVKMKDPSGGKSNYCGAPVRWPSALRTLPLPLRAAHSLQHP
jgi:hypothetical protein